MSYELCSCLLKLGGHPCYELCSCLLKLGGVMSYAPVYLSWGDIHVL